MIYLYSTAFWGPQYSGQCFSCRQRADYAICGLRALQLDAHLALLSAGAQKPGKAVWRGSLAEERPDLVQQWIQESNVDVTPNSVPAGSRFMAAWRCETRCEHCGRPHEWCARVRNRCVSNSGCPVCTGRIICRCQSVAERCRELLDQWDYKRNKGIDLETLGCSSHKKVSWVCKAHGHWTASVRRRAAMGTGCPICAHEEQRGRSRPKRGLVKDEFPNLWEQIHPSRNEGIDVSSLTCGSNTRLIWLCQENKESRPEGCKCEHAWEAFVRDRCAKVQRRQRGCPCAGTAVCECLSIPKLQPELMQFWCSSLNGKLDPTAIGLGSFKRAWWEHVCVDGKLHRRDLKVQTVARNFENIGRFPCRKCAGKELSALPCRAPCTWPLG